MKFQTIRDFLTPSPPLQERCSTFFGFLFILLFWPFFLLLLVIVLTYCAVGERIDSRHRKHKRRADADRVQDDLELQQREVQARLDEPTPLPPDRPAKLSFESLSTQVETAMIRIDSQAQCLLLRKLPPDIRLIIYEFALGGEDRVLHLSRARGRLVHIRCFGEEDARDHVPLWRHSCWAMHSREGLFEQHHPNRLPRDRNLLPLLRTCRVM